MYRASSLRQVPALIVLVGNEDHGEYGSHVVSYEQSVPLPSGDEEWSAVVHRAGESSGIAL